MNNIPGSFTYTDVMFANNPEPALPLESVAGLTTLSFGSLPQGGATSTGLKNDATLYYVKHQIDAAGSATEVSFAGSTAQTFTDLVTALEGVLAGTSSVLVGGDIVITSDTVGSASKVIITPGTTGADLLSSIRSGENVELKANSHQKGHVKYLRWEELDDLEQKELYTIMNGLTSGEADWTHATAGVRIDDSTTSVEVITALTGLAAGTYTLNVTVDGVVKTVSFAVALNSTVTAAFDSFNAAMAIAFPAATVTMVDGTNVVDFMVTSSTPGVEGEAVVAAGTGADFIAAVALLGVADATAVIAEVDGAVGTAGTKDAPYDVMTWFATLNTVKAPNGFPVLSSVGPTAIVEREDKPAMRYIPRADGTYYNGSNWVVWTA